jgi:hypothetical protein
MTQRQIYTRKPEGILFYELEPAVVIDIIRDETHPVFKKGTESPHVSNNEWPTGYNDTEHLDYSWVGRIKARQINSQESVPVSELDWIIPLESGHVEYPLVNELVVVVEYMGSKYYTRRLNTRNFINNSADFRYEHKYGKNDGVTQATSANLLGAKNKSNISPATSPYGSFLGKYFKANNKIRPLKHYEGDTILESRFGSSVRFGCYVDDAVYDVGTGKGHGESYEGNYGNPMILIRNRQHITTEDETKFQYNILEDINRDGSSIHITSGNTKSEFLSTINHSYDNIWYGCLGCRMGGFGGLYGLAKSAIGSKKIQSIDDSDKKLGSFGGVATPNEEDLKISTKLGAVGDTSTGLNPYSDITSSLKNNDLGGALGSAMGTAVGGPIGSKIGKRLGSVGAGSIKKFISSPGSPGSSKPSERKKFAKSIASGNFSLNPEYERGVIKSVSSARKSGKDSLFGSSVGGAISAATSLGIDIPGTEGLGISSNDSPMFKIFKLASFGIKALCASLRKKHGGGYGSGTEEKLGWLLSIGIDLSLLAMLKALFDRLRGLKFNFGSFGAFNLNNLLFDLCDWINQVDHKSSLVDTFRNESNKFLSDSVLTQQLGDKFTKEGTYGAYAKNHPSFDMNYRSLAGDVDAIKDASKSFGQTSLSLQKGGKEKAQVKFDPLTGLFREKQPSGQRDPLTTSGISSSLPNFTSMFSGQPQSTGQVGPTNSTTSVGGGGGITGMESLLGGVSEPYKTDPRPLANATDVTISKTTGNMSVSGVDLPVSQQVVQPKSGTSSVNPVVSPVEPSATKITSYMSGKEITRDSLVGTHLESADLNAVALLDEDDLNTLKDTPLMNSAISSAQKKHDETFDKQMDDVEKSVLTKTDGNSIYGKQLPTLIGNQIILNSERVLISSKTQETGIFSKKKFFVTTDDEITMDAKERIVMRTDSHVSLISPSVHLGLFTTQCHPTLKGDCTTAWLSDLCGWLSSHVHHDPYITTSVPAQQGSLASLRSRLPTLLSERIFISG